MLILGKSKDYYDYVVKERGVDTYVVFNRQKTFEFRGADDARSTTSCVVIGRTRFEFKEASQMKCFHDWICLERNLDRERCLHRGKYWMRWYNSDELYYFMLYIGYNAYLFVYNEREKQINLLNKYYDNQRLGAKYTKIERRRRNTEHLISDAVFIRKCEPRLSKLRGDLINDVRFASWCHSGDKKDCDNTVILNPNLKALNIGIPGFIPAADVWDGIYDYILHNKIPPDPKPVSDKIKLTSHGFDNNSFKKRA